MHFPYLRPTYSTNIPRLSCPTWLSFVSEYTTRTASCWASASSHWTGCRPATDTSHSEPRPTSPCHCPCCSVISSWRSTCLMASKVSYFVICSFSSLFLKDLAEMDVVESSLKICAAYWKGLRCKQWSPILALNACKLYASSIWKHFRLKRFRLKLLLQLGI